MLLPKFNTEVNEWENIDDDRIKNWSDIYTGIDVVKELKKMRLWLEANPKKAKSYKNWLKFMTGWLDRAEKASIKYSKSNPVVQKQRYEVNNELYEDLAELKNINYTEKELKILWQGVYKLMEYPGNYQDIMKHYYVHEKQSDGSLKPIPKILRGFDVTEWQPGMKSKGVVI